MSEVIRKQVCKCENCGNEAEMVFTCTLAEPSDKEATPAGPAARAAAPRRVKGQATCSHCGSEADMWLDL